MQHPRRLEPAGGEENEPRAQLHPEILDFARWFADWWIRRGRRLLEEAEEERRAA
jgi:hypothetical protein